MYLGTISENVLPVHPRVRRQIERGVNVLYSAPVSAESWDGQPIAWYETQRISCFTPDGFPALRICLAVLLMIFVINF